MNGQAQPALNADASQAARDEAWKARVRQFVKEAPRKVKSQIFKEVFEATNYRLPATEECPDELRERVQQRTLAAIHHSNMQAFLEARRCMQFTRCKSRRLPNTELQYIDLDTNTQISAGEYERRYILYLNYTAQQQQKRREQQLLEQQQQPAATTRVQPEQKATAGSTVTGKRSREVEVECEQKQAVAVAVAVAAAAAEEQSESTTSDTDVSEEEDEQHAAAHVAEAAVPQKRIRLVEVTPLQRH